ncbi:MAG: hypothetical protein RBR95_12560 [Ignavibacteriaceae bacterium]|jgi:hypothetical protein|nr:hypothetical protein [Ignavibacteriaceae bacterium]
MEDKEFKKQIVKEAQPLIDKINALKKEIGEADEQEEKAKNEPSSGVKQWIEDNKVGRFKGKTLNREKDEEFTETADFTGKNL